MYRLITAMALLTSPLHAEVPRVVTDIPPIHALVSQVMGDLGTPDLVVGKGSSPHHHAMRPSEARMLSRADVVIWVGPELTRWLEEPIETLASGARVMTLIDVDGMKVLPFREGEMFESHDHGEEGHDGHGHEDHEDHAHEEGDHDAHDHEDENHAEHAHEGEDHDDHAHEDEDHAHKDEHHGEHGHEDEDHAERGHDDDAHVEDAHEGHDHAGGLDPHIWLGPENAQTILSNISSLLAEVDPENAATYAQNAKAAQQEIAAVSSEIEAQLAPVRGTPFVVLHDGFHYFEAHFDVEAVGSISAGDAQSPGAERMKNLRAALKVSGVTCAFTEPGVGTGLLDTATEGLDVRVGILDPTGVQQEIGSGLYIALLREMAGSMTQCLTP